MGVENAILDLGTSDTYDIFSGSDTTYSGVKGITCCGVAGNVVVTRPDGTQLTLPMLAGQMLPISVTKITAAGTTATQILVMRR